MENRKITLSTEQLAYIKTFIRKRGFTEIDLQYEILDHMACKVEEKMAARSGIGFEESVAQAHADFGVLGFSTVEDAIRESLSKQYWAQIRYEFVRWFGSSRFLLVAGSAALLFYTYRIMPALYLQVGFAVAYLLGCIWTAIQHKKAFNKYRNTLIQKTSMTYTVLFPILYFQVWIRVVDYTENSTGAAQHPHPLLAFAFALLVLTCVFAFSAGKRVLSFAQERCRLFEKQYGPLNDLPEGR